MLATKYKFLQFTIECAEWQGLILVRGLSREWVSDLRPARATYYFKYVHEHKYIKVYWSYCDVAIFDHSKQWAIKIQQTNCFKDKNHLP